MPRHCSEEYDEVDCLQLTEREAFVCGYICSRDVVSFSALRRASNLHQEVLSRIIKRLIRYGQVKKTYSGYSCKLVNN